MTRRSTALHSSLGTWLLHIALLACSPTPALSQPAPPDAHFASLRLGDTEAAVIHVMQVDVKEVHRSSVLGVEHTVLIFEIGQSRHRITFFGGRLVAKSVETRPAKWSLF